MSDLEQAAHRFAGMLAHHSDMFSDTMRSLRCEEAETLVEMVDAAGFHEQAKELLWAHAEGDEEGDTHYITKSPPLSVVKS